MKNLIAIFLVVFVFFGCKKKNETTPPQEETPASQSWDAAYIGSYKGTWTTQVYSGGTLGPLHTKDTTLIISPYPAGDSALATSLYNCPIIHYYFNSSSYSIYHGDIYFRNDSMLYYCANGGLGAGNKETFNGKKL